MCRIVAHADHHHAHVGKRRVSDYGYAVVGFVRVVLGVACIVGDSLHIRHFVGVAVLLHVGEYVEVAVDAVALGPHNCTVGIAVGAVFSGRGDLQRHFIFVVVVLHVGSEAQEHRYVAIAQVGGIVNESLIVHMHLQTLVDAQVVACVLVHGTCVAGTQTFHFKSHRLLVELRHLRLTGVDDSCNSGWQHVVHRRAAGVLLNVYRLHIQLCTGIHHCPQRVEVFVVVAPLAAHQVQRRQTQVGLVAEAGQVQAHEADGLEVAYRAHRLHGSTVAAKRYLKLIPRYLLRLTVAKRYFRHFLLGDMLPSHLHHVGAQDDLILEVFLVLVQRVVFVDVLYVGRQCGRRAVGLRLVLRGGRVALGAVIVLVAR